MKKQETATVFCVLDKIVADLNVYCKLRTIRL